MLSRAQQNVTRKEGLAIKKGNQLIVFVHDRSRLNAVRYLAEDTRRKLHN